MAADVPTTVAEDVPDDSAVDRRPDGAADDSIFSEKVSRYRQFVDDELTMMLARHSECFGTSPDLQRAVIDENRRLTPSKELQRELSEQSLAVSMRLGVLDFDEAAAAACLRGVGALSCQRIADLYASDSFPGELDIARAALPECTVLIGKVLAGGPCLEAQDCRPSFTCGASPDNSMCTVCVPKPPPLKLGDDCSNNQNDCPADTDCNRDNVHDDDVCVETIKEGMPCFSGGAACDPGLFCATKLPPVINIPVPGICRPARVGIACASPGQCLDHHYVCIGATPGHAGTCQVGKGKDQPCAIVDYKDDQQTTLRFSDCGPGFACVNLDGHGRKCVDGSPLGGPCGTVDLQDVLCHEGFCDAEVNGPGVCRPLLPLGAPCSGSSAECVMGAVCSQTSYGQPSVCSLPATLVPAIDEHCPPRNSIYRECGANAYCAPPPGYDGGAFYRETGFCAPNRKAGESCGQPFQYCEHLTVCRNGVCTRC